MRLILVFYLEKKIQTIKKAFIFRSMNTAPTLPKFWGKKLFIEQDYFFFLSQVVLHIRVAICCCRLD